VVAAVLSTPALRATWERELGTMRDRIRAMRTGLVGGLKARGVTRDFSFVVRQRGMFSYSGLTRDQVDTLRDQFGIYAIGTGRICLAALNSRNIDYVADSIAKVLAGR
jgi:aromatic-amino-acid transaminase